MPQITSSGTPQPSQLPGMLVAGGYPESITRDPERADHWKRNYVQSVVGRDIRDIAKVKDASVLTRLLAFLESRTAQLLNQSSLSQALGHSRATVDLYLTLLERLFLIRLLPAWHSNRNKRLVKTPKLHFVDSGLAATLGELEAGQWNEERPRFGHLLESFVLQQSMVMADCMPRSPRFFRYRDRDKIEVDIVIESRQKNWGVEIKASSSVNRDDAKGLLKLAGIAGECFQAGIVLCNGEATFFTSQRRWDPRRAHLQTLANLTHGDSPDSARRTNCWITSKASSITTRRHRRCQGTAQTADRGSFEGVRPGLVQG